jgi:1-phosphatidylinositol-3-phosphate 5-kinase
VQCAYSISAFESGGLTISCTVLYPEQFDALRRTHDCEKSMVESLTRCVKWDANGGKSGSAFLKTRGLKFIFCPSDDVTDSFTR